MGIRKPIGVCVAALGLGAALLGSGSAHAGDPPKLKSPVTKGIKPLNPATPPATPPTTPPPHPTTPAPTTTPPPTTPPATTTPPPTTSAKPVTSAAPATSAKPATSGSAAPAAADPTLASLKLSKLEDRLDALRLRVESRQKTLPDRKKAEQDRTRLRWGGVVDQPAVRTELSDHSQRVARLERIQELAIVEGKQAVADRATKAITKENLRHDQKMATLAAAGGK
jgi:hypothetical protein